MNTIKSVISLRRAFIAMAAGLFLMSASNVFAGSTHRIGVNGLACPFCAYGIEKQLTAIPGVKSVKVSVKSGTVVVSMKDGAKLTRGRAGQAVSNAGFSMRSFQ